MEANMLEPFPERPKGMHHDIYKRLFWGTTAFMGEALAILGFNSRWLCQRQTLAFLLPSRRVSTIRPTLYVPSAEGAVVDALRSRSPR